MLKLFLFASVIWTTFGFFPPNGIDFEDKTLLKELQKVSGADMPARKEIPIPETLNAHQTVQGKFFELSGTGDQGIKKYIYVGRVNTCRQGGCSNSGQAALTEAAEYFDYFIVFEPNLSVQQVKVYNYQASHGQEISNKGWLKQFQGHNGNRPLTVGKSIDGISGATISVQAVTADIAEKTKLLKTVFSK